MSEGKLIPVEKFITKYKKSTEYRLSFADSAVIRKTVGDGVQLDFFVGQFDFIDETNVRNPDGSYNTKARIPEEPTYTRELQTGIVMTMDTAEAFANSLIEAIKNIRSLPKEVQAQR